MAISRVQVVAFTDVNPTVVHIAPTVAGNLLVVVFAPDATIGGSSSVIDDVGDVFVKIATSTAPTDSNQSQMWYTITKGGASVVTVDNNQGSGNDVVVAEYSPTSGRALSFTIATGSTNITPGGTTVLGPAVSATGTNNLLVAWENDDHASVTGTLANGGFTFNNVNNIDGEGYADLLNVAAGAYQPKWQMDGATESPNAITAAFAESSPPSGTKAVNARMATDPTSIRGAVKLHMGTIRFGPSMHISGTGAGAIGFSFIEQEDGIDGFLLEDGSGLIALQ